MTVVTVESLLREFGGERNGTGLLTAAPGHSVHDRGMRVWPDPTDPQGFKVYLFNGGDWQSAKDYVARAIGTQEWRPRDRWSRPPLSMSQPQANRLRNVEIAHCIHADLFRQGEHSPNGILQVGVWQLPMPCDFTLRARLAESACRRWSPPWSTFTTTLSAASTARR